MEILYVGFLHHIKTGAILAPKHNKIMKLNKTQNKKGFTLVELLVVISIIAVLAGIATPLILRAQRSSARNEALNNAKGIAQGLIDFKNEYGAYPCGFTADNLAERHDNLPEGDDANAYLAQLILSGSIDSETFFFASGVKGAVKGDDIMGTPDKILARGENSFAYIMAPDEEPLSDTKSKTPLIMAPIKKGGESPIFDDNPYADYYVYGTADGSGLQAKVGKNGEATSKGRSSLFEAGPDSLFGDDTPVIKLPTGL